MNSEERLDRIEALLEASIKEGIVYRKEMKKISEKMEENSEEMKRVFQRMDENSEEMKKNSEEMRKVSEKMEENSEEMKKNSEKMEENSEEMKKNSEKMEENSEEMKRVFQRMDESDARTEKRLRNVTKQLGDIGLVQGEIGEDLFYRNITSLFRRRGKTFDRITRCLKKKGVAEFDIVAINGEEVFVLEVKNKLSSRMVDDFINKGLPRFKKAFPEFARYQVIGGVGALVVKDEVEKYAEEKGLFVFTQSSTGAAEIINAKDFVPRIFS